MKTILSLYVGLAVHAWVEGGAAEPGLPAAVGNPGQQAQKGQIQVLGNP